MPVRRCPLGALHDLWQGVPWAGLWAALRPLLEALAFIVGLAIAMLAVVAGMGWLIDRLPGWRRNARPAESQRDAARQPGHDQGGAAQPDGP